MEPGRHFLDTFSDPLPVTPQLSTTPFHEEFYRNYISNVPFFSTQPPLKYMGIPVVRVKRKRTPIIADDEKKLCALCYKLFQREHYLDKHKCSDLNVWVCPNCEKSYKSARSLSDHMRIYCGNKTKFIFECFHCGKTSHRKSAFISHVKHCHLRSIGVIVRPKKRPVVRRNGEPKYVCVHCGHKTRLKANLYTHIQRVHVIPSRNSNSSPPYFPCPNCGRVYQYKRNLNAHLKVACGENKKPKFECYHCSMKYCWKSAIIYHIKYSHLGFKQQTHSCPICGKILSSKSNLNQHIRLVCAKIE